MPAPLVLPAPSPPAPSTTQGSTFTLVARHSWLGCAVWVGVLGLGFRLRPATPSRGVGVCVCLCGRSACTPSLLAGVCGVGVCAWARVSAAPRHSWLGCWGVCVLVCALRLYPATTGWGVRCWCVCLSSGFRFTPPLLAGVLGCECACVRALRVPRHSWLGCAAWVCVLALGLGCAPPLLAWVLGCVRACVPAPLLPRLSCLGCAPWVCVLGLGFRLRPATPGWGVRVCVCLCAHSACTLPLLARLCGVGVCARAGLRLRPATPGWGVGVCVCLCARSACTPPLLAGVCDVGVCVWARVTAAPRHSCLGCWGVCLLVCALRLYLATPGSGVRCGCVCLRSGFGCNPPLLAWVLGCVCACVRAQLVPRHSWLGCAVWACLFGFRLWLRPALPGWSVGVCLFVCALRFYPATVMASNSSSAVKPVRTPLAILGSLGVCIYVPASRHWLISYAPIHLT